MMAFPFNSKFRCIWCSWHGTKEITRMHELKAPHRFDYPFLTDFSLQGNLGFIGLQTMVESRGRKLPSWCQEHHPATPNHGQLPPLGLQSRWTHTRGHPRFSPFPKLQKGADEASSHSCG